MPLLGKVLPGGAAYTYLPASVRRFPGPDELAALMRAAGLRATSRTALFAGGIVALHIGRRDVTARSPTIREHARASTAYLESSRSGWRQTVGAHGRARRRASARGARRGRQAAAARCSSSSPRRPASAAVAAGVAVELVHMATLVHDDLIDGAEFRRGRAVGLVGLRRRTPRGRPATTSSRARSPSWRRPATRARSRCSPTPRSASRAARRCSARRRTTRTRRVEAYLERCALKTGKLFEAACLLGAGGDEGLGEFGLALGIAFQIADDILDCAGETIETGKIAGTDLREGTPTLPLILAAREDEVVRRGARRRPARRARSSASPRPARSSARARSRSTTRAARAPA